MGSGGYLASAALILAASLGGCAGKSEHVAGAGAGAGAISGREGSGGTSGSGGNAGGSGGNAGSGGSHVIVLPRCGDGSADFLGEECDDGNNESGDGCSSNCAVDLAWYRTPRW